MKVFIIGAGFTKSVFPDAPLNRELIGALSKRLSNSVAYDLRSIYGTDDIEIALTKLDLDDENKIPLRRRVEAELANLFSEYSASYEIIRQKPWLTEFAEKIVSPGDVVISLNYDCLFEGVLDCFQKWSPIGGYGDVFSSNPLIRRDEYPESLVRVLKIHGSVSFRIAPYIDKPSARAVDFVFNERFFPRSAVNTHFGFGGNDSRPYLIAPSYVKIPTVEMTYLMLDALYATAGAKNLVVIGCSLRPEDSFLTTITTQFLRQEGWQSRRLIVVDPCARDICGRMLNFWGVNITNQIFQIHDSLECSVETLMKTLY